MKTITCIIVIAFVMTGISVFTIEEKKGDDEALFETTCSQCHSLNWPKSKKRTAAEWLTIVMRMKNVNDGPFTETEAKIIINYLIKKYGKE